MSTDEREELRFAIANTCGLQKKRDDIVAKAQQLSLHPLENQIPAWRRTRIETADLRKSYKAALFRP